MSGSVVNLNKFRKARAKSDKRQAADENAVKFGRSKAKRDLDKSKSDKSEKHLDGHRRDT